MDLISSILGSVLGGGATGLLGIALQRWFDLKSKDKELLLLQANHTHALALAKFESEAAREREAAALAAQESGQDAAQVRAELDADTRERELETRDIEASMAHDRATYSAGLPVSAGAAGWLAAVDVARGLVRPITTVYLLGLTTALLAAALWLVRDHVGQVAAGDTMALLQRVADGVLYLGTTVILWWFGTRPAGRGH